MFLPGILILFRELRGMLLGGRSFQVESEIRQLWGTSVRQYVCSVTGLR